MISTTIFLCIELREERFKTATHHLATLIESGFYNSAKQTLITTTIFHIVARHSHHSTFHLWRRIKHSWLNCEQIFHIIPQLHQHTEYTIRLITRLSSKTFSHFFLNHPRTAGDEMAIIKHFEEYLTRDVVRIISREHKRAPFKDVF